MADSRRRERERSPRRDRDSDRRKRHQSPSDRRHRDRSRSPPIRSRKEESRRFEDERRRGGGRVNDQERGSGRFEDEQRHARAGDERRRRERSKDERRRDGGDEERRSRMEEEPRSSSTKEDKRLGRPERDRQPGRGGAKGRSKWNRNEDEDYSQYKFREPQDGGSGDEDSSALCKEKADFGLSGKLTAETNTYKGVVIKYSEPQEARQPKTRWRLYQFKGDECINTLYIHRQSAYLIGSGRHIVDFAVDHPSCSKQHAVLQYRLVQYKKEDGRKGRKVRPYIIDLDSTNGTYLNNSRIEPSRYVELKERDVLKFGFSSREYVLLHENSKGDDDDNEDMK